MPSEKKIHILTKSVHNVTHSDFLDDATPTGGALIGAVIGEPYFSSSLLPWHNLHFWYACSALRGLCSPDCVVVPASASLMAIAGIYTRRMQCIVGLLCGVHCKLTDGAKLCVLIAKLKITVWHYLNILKNHAHCITR